MADKPLIRVVLGPTAVGKTDFAISLAKKNGAAVISADSRQLYAGMNIGTGKPKEAWNNKIHDILQPDIVEGVPHYLFGVASPTSPWTLSQWQAATNTIIERLISEHVPVVLAGGTMLYLDSIIFNYSIPEVAPDPVFRNELEREKTEDLYARLIKVDSAASTFIESHHKQRIIRALEVIKSTGKPFSATRLQQKAVYEFEITGLFPTGIGDEKGWELLRERITKRLKGMLEEGLIEETKALINTYSDDLPLLKTMNYFQAMGLMNGDFSQAEALEKMVSANMRYARRQMSWWKNRQDIAWQTR